MTRQDDFNDVGVARLTFRRTETPLRKSTTWSVYPNDQLDIGRADLQRIFNVSDPCVSKHHLKFRCIMYGAGMDDEPAVSPMVYVKVVSKNPIVFSNSSDCNDQYQHPRCIRDVDGDVLLRDGDLLQLTTSISILFQESRHFASGTTGLDAIRQAEAELFQDQFVISNRELGFGGQGSVFLAFDSSSGRQVACKIAELPNAASNARSTREREAYVLQHVAHPNIIALEKVIFTSHNIYIFEELLTAGDLLSYLERNGALTEAQTLVIIYQILKAVAYLHQNGIVHRDIKPENILMSSWRDGARVVLTDFGQSRAIPNAPAAARITAAQRMHSIVGTKGYFAPEVAFSTAADTKRPKGYSKAVDIWSIGCIAATLLTGELLFPKGLEDMVPPNDQRDPPLATWDTAIIDDGPAWSTIGRNARSFVKNCLHLDENRRLSAREALAHVWFTDEEYAMEVKAAYERAVQHWQLREKRVPFIEHIDTFHILDPKSTPAYATKIAEEMHSSSFDECPTPAAIPPALRLKLISDSYRPHSTTPLPDVLQDSWTDQSNVQVVQPLTQAGNAATKLTQPPTSVFQSPREPADTSAHFSIEDFAPPQTQTLSLKQLHAHSPDKRRRAWAPYGNLPFHQLRDLHMPKKRW